MKRIDFPPATSELDLFNLAYIGACNPEARMSPIEMRTHAKILDKLEAVGIKQTDGTGYKLPMEEGATVIFEDAERDLLKRACEGFHWNPAISRRVVKLYDLLEKAPDYIVPKPAPAEPATDASASAT